MSINFDDQVWPLVAIPGEFDAMDACDQQRWRAAVRQAFEIGYRSGLANAPDRAPQIPAASWEDARNGLGTQGRR